MKLFLSLCLLAVFLMPPARAEERTASAKTVDATQTSNDKKEPDKKAGADAPKAESEPEPDSDLKNKEDTKKEPKEEIVAEEPKRPATLDVNMRRLESHGLWSTPKDGGLGRDMWNNTSRDAITHLLPLMSTQTKDWLVQRLRNSLLLTSANALLIKDDKNEKQKAGNDLFTLRLETLLEIGAYDYAAQFYALLDNEEPYHPRLARAGILTQMLGGQKALACLEYKSVSDRDFSSAAHPDFWHDIALYCAYALQSKDNSMQERQALKNAKSTALRNIGKNDKYQVGYNPARFQKYGMMSKAVLKAEGRILQSTLGGTDFAAIPPAHLELLYDEDNSSPRTKLLIHLQRLNYGLTDLPAVEDFLKRETQQLQSEGPKGWQNIPAFYKNMADAQSSEDKAALFRDHLYLEKNHGRAVFIPVAKFIRTIDKDHMDDAELLTAMRILMQADLSMPAKWTNFVLKDKNPALKTKNQQRIFAISIANLPIHRVTKDQIEQFNSILSTNNIIHEEILEIVIENLDKAFENNHNLFKVYEKGALTSSIQSYFLPSANIWEALRQAETDQSIGTIIMLNTLILRELHEKDIYPGLVHDMIKSLNNVGLTNISKDLAMRQFLGE